MDDSDGYYYRDESGRTEGPFDKSEFERRQIKGMVKPGMKVRTFEDYQWLNKMYMNPR